MVRVRPAGIGGGGQGGSFFGRYGTGAKGGGGGSSYVEPSAIEWHGWQGWQGWKDAKNALVASTGNNLRRPRARAKEGHILRTFMEQTR